MKKIAAVAVATITIGGIAVAGCGSSESATDVSSAQEWIGEVGDIATDASADLEAVTECPITSTTAWNSCMSDNSLQLYKIAGRYKNAASKGLEMSMPEPCKAFARQTAQIGERFADLALYAEKGLDSVDDYVATAKKVTSATETGTELIYECGAALMA